MTDTCIICGEPILPGEARDAMIQNATAHFECGFRSIAGVLNHLLKRCHCYGGTEPPDPPDLSKRDAARLASKLFLCLRLVESYKDGSVSDESLAEFMRVYSSF